MIRHEVTMSKRQRKGAANKELVRRIQKLADLIWRGNRSMMGRDLHLSQPVVSRVLAGLHPPSAKFLEALANWPGVNRDFLLAGVGEPLIEPGTESNRGLYLPVAAELLPGPPNENPELLTGVGFPVAQAFYTPSSYWLRVTREMAVSRSSESIVPDDLLLLETNKVWTRRKKAVLGKLCSFCIGSGSHAELLLGLIDQVNHCDPYEDDFGQYEVTLFGGPPKAWLIVPEPERIENVQARSKGEAPPARPLSAFASKVKGLLLGLDDVTGVCIKLDRYFQTLAHQQIGG
jgi:hypothetical protein